MWSLCALFHYCLHSLAALFPPASWTPLSLPTPSFPKLRFLFLLSFSCPSVHSSRGIHTPQSLPRWVFLAPGVIQDSWDLKLRQYRGPSLRKGTQNSEYKIRFKKVNTYLKQTKNHNVWKAEKYHSIIETKKWIHFH